MKIELYHGTSIANANQIMEVGFRDREASGQKNWDGHIESIAGFVYLTRAYPFFYAMNAAKEGDKFASVIKVEVDTEDLFPDEDVLRFAGVEGNAENMLAYKSYADIALKQLGNVAIRPNKIKRIIGRKDFQVGMMWQFSDPAMSPLNYKILGGYYRELTDTWWSGGKWQELNTHDFLVKG